MGKIIRQKLPTEYSIGILLLILGLTFFLSGRLFETTTIQTEQSTNIYLGMLLASIAVIIMVLILWEELLFPIRINPTQEEVIFRNHRNKLKIQGIIYLIIPSIVGFLYANYEINLYSFIPWAAVCIIAPVGAKLVSGINNYNDFLKLTTNTIEYKNNQKEGVFEIRDIHHIKLIKDEAGFLEKLKLELNTKDSVIIDLDEMELDAYFEVIEEYINSNFQEILQQD